MATGIYKIGAQRIEELFEALTRQMMDEEMRRDWKWLSSGLWCDWDWIG